MDTAVSLVKTYLQANGFFTITEYPILESIGPRTRNVTDVDMLALRLPGAGGLTDTSATTGIRIKPDPMLRLSETNIEVIIGEVKEGAAELNKAARDPAVVAAVFRRLGAISSDVEDDLVRDLVDTGSAMHPAGIRLRQVVFATKPPTRRNVRYTWIDIGRATEWLRDQIHEHWDEIRTVQSKDPALGFLILFEKARRGEE